MSGSKARALISSGLFFQKAALLVSKQGVCTSLSVCLSVNLLYFPGAYRGGGGASFPDSSQGLRPHIIGFHGNLATFSPHPTLCPAPHSNGFICVPWRLARAGPGQVAMAISHSFQIELLKDVAFGPEIVQACSPAQQEELS